MDIKIHNGSSLTVSDAVFGREFNEGLVHQAVVGYMAAGRAGTKGQKNRSAVSGGGIKPWKQKGSGRARAGTTRSPLWRTGGVTFAASNRDYSKKMNKKMYRAAMSSIFSELLRQERLVVVDEMKMDSIKTQALVSKLAEFNAPKACIVTEGLDMNLALSARNIPYVDVVDVRNVDPVSLVGADKVIMTSAAVKMVEEWLS